MSMSKEPKDPRFRKGFICGLKDARDCAEHYEEGSAIFSGFTLEKFINAITEHITTLEQRWKISK